MAIVTLGSTIIEIHGSIAGTTYTNKNGKVVAARKKPPSPLSYQPLGNALFNVPQAWRAIPQSTRDWWHTNRAAYGSYYGKPRLSGYNAYASMYHFVKLAGYSDIDFIWRNMIGPYVMDQSNDFEKAAQIATITYRWTPPPGSTMLLNFGTWRQKPINRYYQFKVSRGNNFNLLTGVQTIDLSAWYWQKFAAVQAGWWFNYSYVEVYPDFSTSPHTYGRDITVQSVDTIAP